MLAKIDEDIFEALPFLYEAEDRLLEEIKAQTTRIRIEAGDTIFWEGDRCQGMAIALSGRVRVFKIGENGNEITLYRFGKGEGCILTASCILNKGTFPAIARVEEDGQALLISASVVRRWVRQYEEWQNFICGLLAGRLGNIIATVEEIAFKRMDARLMAFLVKKASEGQSTLITTHQKIASELGTAREVISRILKDLEMRGLITLSRGAISIVDLNELKRWMKNF